MITYLHLENFRSFSNITLDLRRAHGEAKPLAFIYGENGAGKSNLVWAISMIRESLSTLGLENRMLRLFEEMNSEEALKNKVEESPDVRTWIFTELIRPLDYLVREHRRIKCDEPMILELGFYLNNHEGVYRMVFDKEQIVEEELRYLIDKRVRTIFKIENGSVYLSPSIFLDSEYKKELEDLVERYWGKHTFLAIISNELSRVKTRYVKERVGDNFFTVLHWLEELSVCCVDFQHTRKLKKISNPILLHLDEGLVSSEDDGDLLKVKELLNEFLTQIYSDIKSVDYKLTPREDAFKYELILTKQIDGEYLDIPISKESTGTRKLLSFLPLLFKASMGDTVVIDEIDSGIHDLLMLKVLEPLKDSLKGQLIVTTHNTLLLKEMKPEEVYMIVIDANGNKEICCITDYEGRTQKTHNMQAKYLRGDYEGVPYVGMIDYSDFWDILQSDEIVHEKGDL